MHKGYPVFHGSELTTSVLKVSLGPCGAALSPGIKVASLSFSSSLKFTPSLQLTPA